MNNQGFDNDDGIFFVISKAREHVIDESFGIVPVVYKAVEDGEAHGVVACVKTCAPNF